MKPVVDGLWKKYGNQVRFKIFDLSARQGEKEAQDFNVVYLPTFVLLKKDGTILDVKIGAVEEKYLENKLEELTE